MTLQPPQPSRHSPTDSKERNYQQIRVRQDTNENWLKNDPIPASGEWCYSIGWANDPTPRDPANNNPPASKEWYGKFCVDANRDMWECTATSDSQSPPNLVYTWVPVLEDGENVKYKPPVASQCVKIGDSTTPWSQLPWLGGRGIPGPQGDTGDGIRIVGVLGDCGPPEADQAPNPDIGDMWIVSCSDQSDTSDCIINGCDGTAWVWDGSAWQPIGSIQGPPGNNVEYYYQEFAATDNQKKFQLDSTVQVQATFVTVNGVILLPNDYTFTDNADGCELEFLNDIPLKDDDIIMVFSFKGAIDAAVRTLTTSDIATLGVRPTGVKSLLREEIKNQQQANWYLLDKIDSLEIPEDQDLSKYATVDAMEAGDDTTLADAKEYTDNEIASIPPTDLSSHATKKEVTDGDAKSLTDSKKYTDDKIDAIVFPPGTIVKDSEPPNAPNGTNWFDTVRLELFVRASETWVPSSPLGARISQGEIVQAELVDRVTTIEQSQSQPSGDVDKAYVDAQDATKIGNTGEQTLPTSTWKLRARKVDDSGNYSYLAIQDDSLKLYHVADPTAAAHGMSRGYADGRYQFIQKPIGFKSDQSVACTMNPVPSSGEFCGLNNSSPGSSTSANNFFGNFNAGIRVHTDKLLNPEGNVFEVMERYNIAGTVSIFGKDTNKLYFRHGVTAVVRDSSHEYVALVFSTRVPTFGTGAIDAESKYIVIVDGLTSSATNTTLVPEGAEEE